MAALVEYIATGCQLGFLCGLAVYDFRRRKLPNNLVFASLLAILLLGWSAGWSSGQWVDHLCTAALAFVFLYCLFIVRVMGGGDVKFGTTILFWAGPSLALPASVIVIWTGGLLGVLGWIADRQWLAKRQWVPWQLCRHALSARRGVPYGAALACGGVYVMWQFVAVAGGG